MGLLHTVVFFSLYTTLYSLHSHGGVLLLEGSDILWMSSLSPSLTTLSHLFQMAYVSPFPTSSTIGVTSCECKFLGTLVFNHLSPSYHERPTSQYKSSGLRRLNRGSCCTLKFSLSYFSKILLFHRLLQTFA